MKTRYLWLLLALVCLGCDIEQKKHYQGTVTTKFDNGRVISVDITMTPANTTINNRADLNALIDQIETHLAALKEVRDQMEVIEPEN